MKIMHITYDMRIGGTEMVIKSIIENNPSPSSLKMSIFCIESPVGQWGQDLEKKGIHVAQTQRKEGFDFSLIKTIRAQIKNDRIDIIHCHQYTPWVYGTLASIGLKCRVIFTEHGRFYPDVSSTKRKLVNPILALFTNKITTICHATKDALVNYENINRKRISVIYNGISGFSIDKTDEAKIKSQLNIDSTSLVFGTIARLDPIKNHKMMLNAFKRLLSQFPSAVLVIVGDGELREELESNAVSLGIDNNVRFTGYIAYPNAYLSIFDIFLLSSLSEGTSMTLLEAMSLGKPCIVTDAGGNPEIIADKVNGLVTENDNEIEYAKALVALISDKKLRVEFSHNAIRRFAENFTAKKMISDYIRLYK